MAQQRNRPTAAQSLFPNHPSSADDLASARTVRAEPPGNPAARIYQNLKSSGYSRQPGPPEPWSKGPWFPHSAPRAMKKKGK
jgi:hypothetical protein